jgi:hypothetical protein
MPWLEHDPSSGRYKLAFRFGGRKFKKTLKTTCLREAQAIAGGAEKTLLRLDQGLLELPEGADLLTFVLSDGQRAEKPVVAPTLSLQELLDRYTAAHAGGALEANSLATVAMHLRHFRETLGKRFPIPSLATADLQRHVDRRAKERGIRGQLLSPVTLRKEVASLRAAWNWAAQVGLLKGPFPNRGLCFPKTDEKPPFQTWEQIEQRIALGGLTP